MSEKKKDPWTDPDPQPGDFDDFLDDAERVEVEFEPNLEISLISNEEAARLLGPVKAKHLGLLDAQDPLGSPSLAAAPKTAKR